MTTRRSLVAAATVLLWAAYPSSPFNPRVRAQSQGPSSWRPTVIARHGMVAAGHPLAAEAGLRILKAGGNAMDAAMFGL